MAERGSFEVSANTTFRAGEMRKDAGGARAASGFDSRSPCQLVVTLSLLVVVCEQSPWYRGGLIVEASDRRPHGSQHLTGDEYGY